MLLAGSTSKKFQLRPEDVGKTFTYVKTASLTGYLAVQFVSQPSQRVLARFAPTSNVPTISGERVVGAPLTAVGWESEPKATVLSYRWLRDGKWIPGATRKTYYLSEDDAGARISVDVTGSREGYVSSKRSSSPTAAILRVFSSALNPAIIGSPTIGSTLRVSTPPWSPAPAQLTYQWKRDGVSVPGATGTTYELKLADFKSRISVTIIGTKPGYAKETRTSPNTTLVLKVLSSSKTPTIGGTPQVGSTLAAQPGVWSPSPVELSYQWKRDGVAISGATAKTYNSQRATKGVASPSP